jgi:acyl-CoA thioester hydrolase
VRVWVKKLGKASLTFGLRVMPMDEDVDYATGHRVIVRVDPDTRAAVPWSDGFRETIAAYREDLPDSDG